MDGETFVGAARDALSRAMTDDPNVVVIGEDVATGGAFGLTKDLLVVFGPDRVRNTPISESSFMGVGVGLALAGARPIVDIMFDDFITLASDQLFNHAAKLRFMSGGRRSVPLTIWTVAGAGTRWGAQHSQRLDGWFAQIPGLKVLCPSSPEMASRSLQAAVRDEDPVVIIADRSLLYSRAPLCGDSGSPWSSRIVQSGRDVTVVASGRLVHAALDAAASLDISVEIIDLQRAAPIATELIAESVRSTGHLVVIHDEPETGALTALVVNSVYRSSFWHLDTPIATVTSPASPVPASPNLEDAYMVSIEQIRAAIVKAIRQS